MIDRGNDTIEPPQTWQWVGSRGACWPFTVKEGGVHWEPRQSFWALIELWSFVPDGPRWSYKTIKNICLCYRNRLWCKQSGCSCLMQFWQYFESHFKVMMMMMMMMSARFTFRLQHFFNVLSIPGWLLDVYHAKRFGAWALPWGIRSLGMGLLHVWLMQLDNLLT